MNDRLHVLDHSVPYIVYPFLCLREVRPHKRLTVLRVIIGNGGGFGCFEIQFVEQLLDKQEYFVSRSLSNWYCLF
ncbi:MAG: hypothetical protein ACLR8Y_02070 [Alistipes indistinctus]